MEKKAKHEPERVATMGAGMTAHSLQIISRHIAMSMLITCLLTLVIGCIQYLSEPQLDWRVLSIVFIGIFLGHVTAVYRPLQADITPLQTETLAVRDIKTFIAQHFGAFYTHLHKIEGSVQNHSHPVLPLHAGDYALTATPPAQPTTIRRKPITSEWSTLSDPNATVERVKLLQPHAWTFPYREMPPPMPVSNLD